MNTSSLEDAAVEGLQGALRDVGVGFLEIRQFLIPGERAIYSVYADWKPPFWICILPFVPDIFTRAQYYLTAVTNQRVLIVRMSNPLFGDPKAQDIYRSIPLEQPLDAIPVGNGMLLRDSTGFSLKFRQIGDGPQIFIRKLQEARLAVMKGSSV